MLARGSQHLLYSRPGRCIRPDFPFRSLKLGLMTGMIRRTGLGCRFCSSSHFLLHSHPSSILLLSQSYLDPSHDINPIQVLWSELKVATTAASPCGGQPFSIAHLK